MAFRGSDDGVCSVKSGMLFLEGCAASRACAAGNGILDNALEFVVLGSPVRRCGS